jgi:hypothetical protein
MATLNKKNEIYTSKIKGYLWGLAAAWTIVIALSLAWNVVHMKQQLLELARIEARVAFTKDVIYRRWNALHGGVYVPQTQITPGNPYLADILDRDITTPSGKRLTLMNPAYMTRQSHELMQKEQGLKGHITSLNPIRPENAADAWETTALKTFEQGNVETSSLDWIDGNEYMRLMRPLVTEKSCLQCHARQGYREGNIRGGISAAVPMEPLRTIEQSNIIRIFSAHAFLWFVGLIGLRIGALQLLRSEHERLQAAAELVESNIKLKEENTERKKAEEVREKLVHELQEALAQVKQLSGFLPICASCKKIRDDKGYWNQIETYISNHSEAEFSHGLCPDCAQKYTEEIHKKLRK